MLYLSIVRFLVIVSPINGYTVCTVWLHCPVCVINRHIFKKRPVLKNDKCYNSASNWMFEIQQQHVQFYFWVGLLKNRGGSQQQ